ncbi:MAG: L-histidine N(alpha)-methyltransferase [Betaproteobacteria bacterium]|nr:L-histidine N(alpha)-methyltransferase [Betaproteobacteria bacterium]
MTTNAAAGARTREVPADSRHAAGRDRPAAAAPAGMPRIVVHRLPDGVEDLARLKAGVVERASRIEPKFFYDEQGCALFGAIRVLPEYYLTRVEAGVFEHYRDDMARCLPSRAQWIDLGCGDGLKSRPWIRATGACRFIGVDIARASLATALADMAREFPALECLGVVTDLAEPLELQCFLAERPARPPVFFYPGSSLGNFTTRGALALLKAVRDHVGADGALLVGVDLVKDVPLLEAAYDDALGVTAAFNRNVLRVVNRLLDADFDPGRFAHRASWNARESRIEMRLEATQPQRVRIDGLVREYGHGESILTEYSHKYTVAGFLDLLAAAGFSRQRVWTDERGWFGVFLAMA